MISHHTSIPAERLSGLRRYNLIAGLFHLIQGIAILALSNDFALPVSISYLTGAPTPNAGFEQVHVMDVRVGVGVALFSLLSAAFHLWIVGPGFARYSTGLARSQNIARWVEYAISSTLMIVLIGMVNAVWNAVALLGIIGCNVSMILFGWLQEKYEQPGSGGMLPFWFGCIAGAVPWIAMFWLLIAPGATNHAPGFVYGIVISLFLLFNCFAVVQWLQYRQIGRWRDYLVGERTYITLSFVAKTALAWQIFAGVLATSSMPG